MNRNIPNRPHPTPDPEKPHAAEAPEHADFAMTGPASPTIPEHGRGSRDDLSPDEPTYDSCFDDLNQVLSQSMEQPDPDPNLDSASAGGRSRDGETRSGRDGARRRIPPRTSEIFAVVAPGQGDPTHGEPAAPADSQDISGEVVLPGLNVLDRRTESSDDLPTSERAQDITFPWGQIALLSYSSVLTLALIWMFWTGRLPGGADPAPALAGRAAAVDAPKSVQPTTSPTAPPIPPENIASIGRRVRLGDLEVTPLSIEARPVDLVRTIDPDRRRRADHCLVLRLRLLNLSKDQTLTPLDRTLIRERDIRAFDPYIASSKGAPIRLFPLAMDSEWSILGQSFPTLEPGESAETFVAAEPGSADRVADGMTWRLRLRIGVYRSDMLGVRFASSDVRQTRAISWDDEE